MNISNRDDFSPGIKRRLAERVGFLCSNPECNASTSGPQKTETKSLNIGVAAHITAAAPNGPRHDLSLSPAERAAIANGIWLCQNCAKLVDNDPIRFHTDLLRQWKSRAEEKALWRIGKAQLKTDEETGDDSERKRIYDAFDIFFETFIRSLFSTGKGEDKSVIISQFKSDTARLPFLGMPSVEALRGELVSNARILQRLQDKLNGRESQIPNDTRQQWISQEAELINWFDGQKKGIVEVFRTYLSINEAENELSPNSNNPYCFPRLIETTLKKHIARRVNECPFKEIIERITLYDGVVNHYQIIVEAPINHIGFKKVEQFWDREAPDIFEDNFLEIYKEIPEIKFRYKKGSFWNDWSCLTTDIRKELSDGLVNIMYKWILYEK